MSADEKEAPLRAVAMSIEEEPELSASELDANDGRSSMLNALVNEARTELVPASRSWERVEARLMQDLPAASRLPRSRIATTRAAVVLLAVAAGIGLFLRHRPEPIAMTPPVAVVEHVASAFRGTEGTGSVTINGALVTTAGLELHANDRIGADHARALFERPNKVSWLVESEATPAHARVSSAGEPLVLSLDDGAVEAQVVPVPVGEAFAVDIAPADHDRVRVAVHGTHLRVTRTGDHVVVDLSEGVVAIGVPPADGITHGLEVRAPAHIELDATDLSSIRVTRTGLRAPIGLGGHVVKLERGEEPVLLAGKPTDPQPLLPSLPSPVAHPFAPSARGPHRTSLAPRDAIVAAIRECAGTAGRERTHEVRVTVTSDLQLQVDPGGTVTSAQFTPPLLPEIQTCAASAIYRTMLDQPGVVTIPIEFSY